jgi:hypothetical protein
MGGADLGGIGKKRGDLWQRLGVGRHGGRPGRPPVGQTLRRITRTIVVGSAQVAVPHLAEDLSGPSRGGGSGPIAFHNVCSLPIQ